ncbi:hypothetical protein LguiA_027858 [Lonicera macranthoides]
MPYLLSSSSAAISTLKALTQCDSPYYTPTISSVFNPHAHRKITHITIFLSCDSSSASSSFYSCSRASKQTPTNKSLNNLNSRDPICAINDDDVAKTEVSVISTVRKRSNSLWRKILVGSKYKKTKSILLLHAITIVYASTIPVVKEVEAFMDPAAFSAVRFALSAIPFLPFVFRARNDVQTRNAGIELGLWVSLGYLIEALGLITCDAGRASFISLFTVIVVPMLESMLGAIVPARTWFGIMMSVLGVAMLECSGSPPTVGDLLNFLSAIFFGIHTLRTEHISRSTKKENFLALLGYEVCVVALLSTIWYLVGGYFNGLQDSNEVMWTWTVLWDWMVTFPWVPALYTGAFSTGLCLWAEIAAMRDVSATETAIIYGLEPLWGAGFAWFLLGERWGIAGWIGAALVLGGSLTVQMLGSSPCKSGEIVESINERQGLLLVSNKKQKAQISAVVISSRKDVIDMLNK